LAFAVRSSIADIDVGEFDGTLSVLGCAPLIAE
jgi:hypothetical protein